ncbi:MAG: 4-hydroxy-tetrahydrodipicolinate synthase [Magnetococcales bacterium]|nr:4-hydroxy-tetrahydrodipicolinate synthase [Magnetococcales bacterium]
MFEGVFSALITPFTNGRFDRQAFTRLVEYQIQQGISGVVPCGTTGESATLTHDEHKEVIQFCVELVNGRVPVIAGTGSNATQESIALTRFAKEVGADGALLITPYYNKPTQEGLYQHYKAVATAVDIPIVLYNVPGRTAVDMGADTVARLAETANIVAVKEATANLERASIIHKKCGDSIALISGDDATFLPFLAVGGRGVISVSANIATAAMVALWKAWLRGDWATAHARHQDLLDLNGLLFCETSPIPIKAAAEMLGLSGPELRLPLTPLSPEHRQPLRQAMEALNLFELS